MKKDFLRTLKQEVPKEKLYGKDSIYEICQRLEMEEIVNGYYASPKQLKKLLIEEIQYQADGNGNKEFPNDASWEEIRQELKRVAKNQYKTAPSKKRMEKELEQFLDQKEKRRAGWQY